MKGPLFVEINDPVIAKSVPLKFMPDEPVVFRSPTIVVIPEPAAWVIEAAEIPSVVMFVA